MNHSRTSQLRALFAEPATGLLVVTSLALVGVIVLIILLGEAAVSRLNHQEQLTCQRMNITRATDNQAHLNTYLLYQFVTKRFLITTPTETAEQRHVTEQFAAVLRVGLRQANWTPLVNCTAPGSVVRSLSLRPVRFSDRMPPNPNLSSVNAARPAPTGSVP